MSKSVSRPVDPKTSSAFKLRMQPRLASTRSADLADLKNELLVELAPQTALQRSVSKNLVDNELELLTLRDRKSLIFWEAALRAMRQLLCASFDPDAAWDVA